MADDLVFPPDDISSLIGDFESNINEDAIRSDVNPSFPHSELLNFPQIMPTMMASSDSRRAYTNTNNVDNSYTPISQLMKQTEELTSTLRSPLSSSINQQSSFGSITNSTSPTVSNTVQTTEITEDGLNFVNSLSPKNTQYLVVGGQRISAPHRKSQPQAAVPQLNSSTFVDINPSSLPNNISVNKSVSSPSQMQQQSLQSNAIQPQKQSLVLKVPSPLHIQQPNHYLQTGVQGQKGPLKGSIIKTASQQLMFVTEVNGKKVGYVIQHPKPNSSISQTVSQCHSRSAHLAVTSAISPGSTLSLDSISKNTNKTGLSPFVYNVEECSQLIQKDKDGKSSEMARLIREKLQGLRTSNVNFKNQLNLKQPVLSNAVKSDEDRVVTINSASKIVSDFENVLSEKHSEKLTEKIDMSLEGNEFVDDEEGQEIEFSENDLIAENNEVDFKGPQMTSISVKECNEIEDITEETVDDEDSDSVPLALLKSDTFEEPISIVCEKRNIKVTTSAERLEHETSDSLPLSVVAASLKKCHEDGKVKKRGRKKKKKKDENEPAK